MDDHSFLSTEPSRLDGMSLHDALPHQLRETRTPPLAGPSSHDPVYTTVGTYGEYPIPYNNSSLPTPVSGAGSPETPESTQELPMVKHEPGTGDHDSPRSTSRAEWHYENSVSYHSHPHSPGTLHHQSHGYAMYDGLEGSDEPDIHRPAATEPSFWPSPALTTEVMPYSMDMNSSAMVRHDMPLAPNLHALQTPHHQSHLYRQSHDTYERNYHASASSSNDLGGVAQSYPQYHHAQPSLVVNEHKAETRDASRSSKSRSQKASRRSSGARRIRNKRATPRPRDNSDDRPEQYPLNPEERIALDDNVKEQDRYLYELRCELGAFNGEDMWDQIVQRYAEKYAPKRKATLQMQLNRALAKHQRSSSSQLTAR
ncbi:uncharacterized protein B0I36DRAFT_141494 [Microdochium trichocladiopsis]|uniref:Uncharacterized protein n=1 Tax=Microdochium trichocladiopsis TaxID=1682393 RepID=A0A9P9BNE4_9PEZI|nr:uncharacterized protein B0I36DRAFT_141494 [Microdochium trichocladiopsis]KAH7027653.1 hypothetical protein B0I36DRAFT_141494 [Microdochium trichocladiopsis]